MYKVSVVTPFHNVDMGMFQKAADSMRAQTIGFENVEWVIVVHNCEPQYLPQLQEMFKDEKNVLIKELNNEARTPSSPRNYGMKFVTAPYVGYLDGDDSYTTDCLEVVVREAVETQSQVVTFRREYELEKETLFAANEIQAWDLTEWRIVMDHDNLQKDNMFSSPQFITSRLFDVSFLRNHNITFSEEIIWAEDFMFASECLLQADRVCYLPQFIGYHYFINSGSMVQNKQKSFDELVSYFKGVNTMLDFLDSYQVDFNVTGQFLYIVLAQYILSSDLTVEQRKVLCDLAAPYINRFVMLPKRKTYTPEFAYFAYHLSREVMSNPENPMASPILREALNGWSAMMEILRRNVETNYGCRYHFDQVYSLEDYQSYVPLSNYDQTYKRLIDLQTNIGESNILTTEHASHYLLNAKKQLIPCTPGHLRQYMEAFATTLKGCHNVLVTGLSPAIKQTNDGCKIETLESLMVKEYFMNYLFARGQRRAEFCMPEPDPLSFNSTPLADVKTLCQFALLDTDVDQIVALDTQKIADFFDYMMAHREELVDEIRQTNPARADEVNAILTSGQPIAKALWPKLERVVAFGAGEMYEATNRMKQFTGDVPHNNGYYYTEETIYGRAVGDNTDVFETMPDSGSFHEYLPLGIDSETTILSTDVQPDQPYQLVVSNKAGLYRFVTDHVVRIKEVLTQKVQFTIY